MPNFLDSNVLVYAYDTRYPGKRAVAQELVRLAFAGGFVVSTQVLAEFSATLLQEFEPVVPPQDLMAILERLAPIRLIVPDAEMVHRAVEAHAAYGINFYDGMIVAAAERVGAKTIMSEDLNVGQEYFGVTIANPFA
jgi:predicted nucleic acid-binding protein